MCTVLSHCDSSLHCTMTLKYLSAYVTLMTIRATAAITTTLTTWHTHIMLLSKSVQWCVLSVSQRIK